MVQETFLKNSRIIPAVLTAFVLLKLPPLFPLPNISLQFVCQALSPVNVCLGEPGMKIDFCGCYAPPNLCHALMLKSCVCVCVCTGVHGSVCTEPGRESKKSEDTSLAYFYGYVTIRRQNMLRHCEENTYQISIKALCRGREQTHTHTASFFYRGSVILLPLHERN